MEPIATFTSRADLPADAVNISADSRRAASLKLAVMICDRTGLLIPTSLLTYIVPNAFKRYQPASGATVDPALTSGHLYCYLNRAELEQLSGNMDEALTRGCLYRYLTRGKLV